MSIVKSSGGVEKVTIDGEKVRRKMDLVGTNFTITNPFVAPIKHRTNNISPGSLDTWWSACETKSGVFIANGSNGTLEYILQSDLYFYDGEKITKLGYPPSITKPNHIIGIVASKNEDEIIAFCRTNYGGSGGTYSANYKYSLTTKEWTFISYTDIAPDSYYSAVSEGDIHHILGNSGSYFRRYNETSKDVTELTRPPQYSTNLVLHENMLKIFANNGSVCVFNKDNNSWTTVNNANGNYSGEGSSVFVEDDYVRIIGGERNPFKSLKYRNGSFSTDFRGIFARNSFCSTYKNGVIIGGGDARIWSDAPDVDTSFANLTYLITIMYKEK